MGTSFERMAMLEDVHGAGNGVVAALAREYGVVPRTVYKWMEDGFPQRWDERDHELWRERFIRFTGGAHLIGHWQELAAGRSVGDGNAETFRREAGAVVVAGAELVTMVNEALADGVISAAERLDLQSAITRTMSELSDAQAALMAIHRERA